jgi:hypothetical protein
MKVEQIRDILTQIQNVKEGKFKVNSINDH